MKRLSDTPVSTKVIWAFAVVLLATLVLGIFSNTRLFAVNSKAQELGERWLPDMQQLGQLQDATTQFRSWQGAVLLTTSAASRADAMEHLKAAETSTAKLVRDFDLSTDTDTEKALSRRVSETWAAYVPMLEKEMAIEKDGGTMAAFDYYSGPMKQAYEAMREAVAAAVKYHTDGGAAAVADSKQTYASSRNWNYATMLLAVLLCVGAGYLLIQGVSRPLMDVTGAMEQLASGNLEAHVPHADQQDEIGHLAHTMTAFKQQLAAAERSKEEQTDVIVGSIGAGLDHLAKGDLTHRIDAALSGPFVKLKNDFNAAMGHLQETVASVLSTTGIIATGAGEISQAADDLSRRTEQQAASLEETSAALEQITATVKKSAANTNQVNASMASARVAAEEGGKVVETATTAMDAISQSSKKITDIIGVIDEIAFQTNLLALNAGVEAARAGEAGKGFAVVAIEVRALAGRSGEAAKQIKTLINASGEQVADGVKHVAATGSALSHIVREVQQINAIVQEMAEGAQQEATGIEQVNAAVGSMDQVTQQNAAMVEQSTAASRSLAEETRRLQSLVGFFNVGHSGPVRSIEPPPRRVSRQAAKPAHRTATVTATALDGDWSEF